jgi:IS5 family transposase
MLQQWYGLNDLEVERKMADRISFMSFLGFSDPFPGSSIIWLSRERKINTGKDKIVWPELQILLYAMGSSAKRGTIQEVTFIHTSSVKELLII